MPTSAAVIRCHVMPSCETHTRPWFPPPAAWPWPPATNPVEVLVRTKTWSPGSRGSIPCVAASVHDRPFWLVQITCGPHASQPVGPAAIRSAMNPTGGSPPPGNWTGARCQVAPPSEDTKNCWRATPLLVSEPVVTIVLPHAAIRSIVWKTPRCCCPWYVGRVLAEGVF